MYEYHGWVTLLLADNDEDWETEQAILGQVATSIQVKAKELDLRSPILEIKRANIHTFLAIAGCRNHSAVERQNLAALFEYIGEVAPLSYGLLYTWDDELKEEDGNKFKVMRMVRGKIDHLDDPFLSPCIPLLDGN